jgi:O-methyltransferase involved in polyketide biosynthesis
VWAWAGFAGAELLATREAGAVLSVTDLVLGAARLLRPGTPSLRWSLAQRHAMIDHLARTSGAAQVLELAAGLSRRGVALTEDPGVRYVEVDLPPMVARKEALLGRSEAGRAALGRSNLVRVGADAREVDLGGLLGPGPACVIAEGLLMYLEAEAQRALWRRIAGALADRPGSVLVFDLVPASEQPAPGLVGRALGWCMARFTGGRGFVRDLRTRQDVIAELRGCGFGEVAALEPGDLAEAGPPGLGRVRTQVVVFRCGARHGSS